MHILFTVEWIYSKLSICWTLCFRKRFHGTIPYGTVPIGYVWALHTHKTLELMLENCAGDICKAGVQENNREKKERQSIFFQLRSLPIRTDFETLHQFTPVEIQFQPNSKPDPVGTDKQSQMEHSQQPKGNMKLIRT